MTLLLAAVRPKDILLTADSRATNKAGGSVTFDDHYQKLFPVPEHPVVIAHDGENILDDKPVAEFLADFIKHLNVGNHKIQGIADALRTYAYPAVRTRLKALNLPDDGCGFWVAGFTFHEEEPSLIELFWIWKDETLVLRERRFSPLSAVYGGNGMNQIHAVDWHPIQDKPIAEVRAYHHTLMDEALNAKVSPNSVGGTPHELLITREEWKWTLPAPQPPAPAPALEPTTAPTTRGVTFKSGDPPPSPPYSGAKARVRGRA